MSNSIRVFADDLEAGTARCLYVNAFFLRNPFANGPTHLQAFKWPTIACNIQLQDQANAHDSQEKTAKRFLVSHVTTFPLRSFDGVLREFGRASKKCTLVT